jgi:hypothetical protein
LRFHLASDTSRDLDTLVLRPGIQREHILDPYRRIPLFLKLTPSEDTCDIAYVLRANAVQENQDFKNPSTLKSLTEYKDLTERLLLPKREALNLRATQGVQRLLNRQGLDNDAGGHIFHEFSVSLANRSALQADTGFIPLRYPIVGEARFLPQDGKMRADLHLILIDLAQP